jgi:PAS domain S-box-containing protein
MKVNKNKINLVAESLLESERHFSDLLYNSNLIAVLLDLDGKVVFCNPCLLNLTGYKSKETIGKDWFTLMIPENSAEAKKIFIDDLKLGHISEHFENPIITKKRELLHIIWNNTLLRDNSGAIIGTASIGENITERKLAESLLLKTKNSLDSAQTQAHIGNWELDPLTGNGFWSKGMYLLFNQDETNGPPDLKEFSSLVHPHDWERLMNVNNQVLKTGESVTVGYRSNPDRGPEKCFETTIYAVKEEQGNLMHLAGTVFDITERKRVEEALRHSEEKYNKAFHNSPDAITITRASDGLLLEVNESFERISGFNRKEVLGRRSSKDLNLWVNSDDRDLYTSTLKEKGRVTDFETEFRTKYNEIRNFVLSGEIYEINGEYLILGIIRDITERKRAEKSLLQQTALLEAQLHSSIEGILVVDNEGKKILQNKRMVDIWKIPPHIADNPVDKVQIEYVTGMTINPDLFVEKIEFLNDHKDNTSFDEVELTDGTFLERYSAPVIGKDGHYFGRIWTFRDITEFKRSQETLKQSEERFSTVFINSPAWITLVHIPSGKMINANTAWEKLTGYKQEEALGKSPVELGIYEQGLWDSIVKEVIDNGSVKNHETYSRNKKGELRILLVSREIITIREEKHILSMGIDITERKKNEEEIVKLNDELEQRVIRRTSELAIANKELESFSYTISHDLRAPLRAIYGFSQILAGRHSESLNEEGKKYMKYIVQASERMEQLINDLLNYSRLGRKSVKLRLIKLHEVLNDIKSDFQTELDNTGATLKITNELPEIYGDDTLLRQIFTNLLGNAIKYRKTDTALVISVSYESIEGGYILKVNDNGIGIAKEYWGKIFNVFQRLHSEEKYPGTGIGLATVKKAVTLLGGTIYVDSTVGTGSSFVIEIHNPKT